MTTPNQARSNHDGVRTYAWPPTAPHEFEVISVTSAIKLGIPKEFLVGWAAKMSAEFCVDNLAAVTALVEGKQKRAAVDLIKGARYRDMNEKADRGTIVHAAVEAYIAGKPLDKDAVEELLTEKRVPQSMFKSTHGMISGLLLYLQDSEPEVIHSERTVYSRTHGYAGTSDIIGRTHIGGSRRPAIVDVKTSKRIYNEVAIQLAAYARADFVGEDDGTEIPLLPFGMGGEKIEHGVVVRPMASGKYETATFALTDDVFNLFLGALQVARLSSAPDRARRPS